MVKLENIVFNDSYTSDYLIEHCKVDYTSPADLDDIASILVHCFHIPKMHPTRSADVMHFLYDTKFDIYHSVKLYDPTTNRIYGILMIGNRKLNESNPILGKNILFNKMLESCTQINGIGFLIDERLRGQGFDRKMLTLAKKHIDKFDLIWHGVDNSLNTHNYWKYFGFKELLDDGYVKFYTKFLS